MNRSHCSKQALFSPKTHLSTRCGSGSRMAQTRLIALSDRVESVMRHAARRGKLYSLPCSFYAAVFVLTLSGSHSSVPFQCFAVVHSPARRAEPMGVAVPPETVVPSFFPPRLSTPRNRSRGVERRLLAVASLQKSRSLRSCAPLRPCGFA